MLISVALSGLPEYMVNEAMGAYSLKEKTVNNSLAPLHNSRKIRRKLGRYALTPGQIQLMENAASNRAPSIEGRNMGKTQSLTGVSLVPDCFSDAQSGNCDLLDGNSSGTASIPVAATDLGGCPPDEELPLTGGPLTRATSTSSVSEYLVVPQVRRTVHPSW